MKCHAHDTHHPDFPGACDMNGLVSKLSGCAIYTRKSTEHNLDLAFNSLDAQREACEAYIKSQAAEGWRLIPDHYDDGAFSGASLERPALQALLADVRAHKVDVVVVYKVDRLTRSLADFAKLIELFEANDVSFVSVTQSFNTSSSMGRLTLNVLLSFAQFERELIGAAARLGSEPWRICSRTVFTSGRWCTADKPIAVTTPRSWVVICSRPCRKSSRRKPSRGAAACAAHPLC
jgi:Resolvase, N terminal domain